MWFTTTGVLSATGVSGQCDYRSSCRSGSCGSLLQNLEPAQFRPNGSSLALLRQFLHLAPVTLILRIMAQKSLVGFARSRPILLLLVSLPEISCRSEPMKRSFFLGIDFEREPVGAHRLIQRLHPSRPFS